MRKVRIAQIGLNAYSHSVQIFKRLGELSDIFEVVGICFPENEEQRLPGMVEKIQPFTKLTLEQVLNDPTIEAVSVEVDEQNLTKYAIMAVQHGKHVHMEKPGGTDPEEFEELIRQVKAAGKVFHTGYMYRYNPCVQSLLQKVRSGQLGKILNVEAQMNCYNIPETRQFLKDMPGGMMFFLGCHLIDLILLLQGQPKMVIPMNRATGQQGDALDQGMALLEYDTGISFAKTCCAEFGGFARRQLVVTGTLGTVEIRPLEWGKEADMYTEMLESYEKGWHVPGQLTRSEIFDRYKAMLRAFGAMVRGEQKNPYTPDYELQLYKTVLQACGQ